MVEQNTAQLWDSVWERSPSIEKDLYAVRKEERLIRWQHMEAAIAKRFGGFEGLSVIDLGAGRGTNAALMAARGAQVTVLDYSEGALERSRRLFDGLELQVDLVLHDALDLPDVLRARYDVSMSFGLAEHFWGEPRAAIVKAHFDVLKEGGIAFISVPNAHNPPYRLYASKLGTHHDNEPPNARATATTPRNARAAGPRGAKTCTTRARLDIELAMPAAQRRSRRDIELAMAAVRPRSRPEPRSAGSCSASSARA